MHLYKGFDAPAHYILSYIHNNTHAADTSAALFTKKSIALIVKVWLKWKRARAAHHLS